MYEAVGNALECGERDVEVEVLGVLVGEACRGVNREVDGVVLLVMEGAGDEGGVECDCPAIVGALYEELGGARALCDRDVA